MVCQPVGAIYLEGLSVLPVIIFAVQIYGLSYALNVGLVIKDKTPTVAIIGIISAVFCVAIELWLIPNYGMAGASWSILLSNIIWTGGVTILSLKVYPISYNLVKIAIIFFTSVIGYIGLRWILQTSLVSSLVSLLIALVWLAFVFGIAGLTLVRKSTAKAADEA